MHINFEAILAIIVFKTLFMNKISLKIKGLKGQNYFNVIQNLLSNKELNEKEKKVIEEMLYEININQ